MSQPIEQVYGHLIDRTSKSIKKALSNLLREMNTDLTVDQWVVIYQLHEVPDVSQYELGEMINKDKATLTKILDLLQGKGILTRNNHDSDRRKSVVRLTDQGHVLVERLLPEVSKLRAKGWRGLSNDDFKHLKKMLDTVHGNFTTLSDY